MGHDPRMAAYPGAMCVACVGAASPEIAVAVGGYAAVRLGRPLQRLRGWRAGREIDQPDDQPDDLAKPCGSAV
jgi:hypothetical protein